MRSIGAQNYYYYSVEAVLTGVDNWNLTSAFSPRSSSDTTSVKITEPIPVFYKKKFKYFHNLLAVCAVVM